MISNLPHFISIFFIITTISTIWFIQKANNNSIKWIIGILLWLALQVIITFTGFYTYTDTIPPRFLLLIGPPLLLSIFLFISSKGKSLIDGFNTKWLTYLHIVRIPVEFVLYWLYVYKYIPEIMTFEGRNFDILSGITAPFIAYLGYTLRKLSKSILICWNIACLLLLLNIVLTAILSAPSPIQKFAFDQPNVGIFYFPFSWLPCFIVPAVLLSHLICLKELLTTK